jgi:hypothetical protein
MILSLTSFNPKNAPEALLSAIYFAGFVAQPNPSNEILTYMKTYALTSIKKILLSVKLSSAQALGIYSYAYLLIENSSMSRVCLSHFGRMCHALGISANRSNLPILDQFNRKFTCNILKIYYNWTKLGPSSYDLVSEEVEADLDIYEPKYQIPSPDLNLFDNFSDCIVYSIFCSQFTRIFNHNVYIASKFINYNCNKIEGDLETLHIKSVELYDKAKSALESMINLIPKCKMQILAYMEYIKAVFITCTLSIQGKIAQITNNASSNAIQKIIDSCIELWEVFSKHSHLINIWSFGPYTIAFHLIQVFSHSNKTQRKTVLFILKSIIQLYHKEGIKLNSMIFIILQTQFNMINSKNL